MTGILHVTQPDGIIPFPDFIFAEMARRGVGSVEVELSSTESARQPPVRWQFRRAGGGEAETIAETRPTHFRAILARVACVCGINPYGGETSFPVDAPSPGARGTHHYSIVLRNSQQLGFGIRISFCSIDDSPNPTGNPKASSGV
jgi:hypothetical protein